MLYGPLNGWWLYTAKGIKRETIAEENQKADREAKQAALTRGPAPTALMAALFPYPLTEWDPQYTPKNRLGLRQRREIFYQMDGGSLLMATLPSLSHWLLHLSGSSIKELIQCEEPLSPPWPSTFMPPNSPA
jgi:hypothetical protein